MHARKLFLTYIYVILYLHDQCGWAGVGQKCQGQVLVPVQPCPWGGKGAGRGAALTHSLEADY